LNLLAKRKKPVYLKMNLQKEEPNSSKERILDSRKKEIIKIKYAASKI